MSAATEDGIQARSFGGCDTCRRRRIKCDEDRPACTTCKIARISCGGYAKSIFFENDGDNEDNGDGVSSTAGAIRFRRPLFSEEERARMSRQLAASVPPRLAYLHLAKIDADSEGSAPDEDVNIQHGPFGVFRVSSQIHGEDHNSQSESSEQGTVDSIVADDDAVFEDAQAVDTVFPPITLSPRSQALLDSMFDPDTSGFAVWEEAAATPSLAMVPNVFDTALEAETEEVMSPDLPGPDRALSIITSVRAAADAHDAVMLIKYYATTVLGFLAPVRHAKTPWHVLFIPHAKHCLATLSMGEPLDRASLCAFYGTLAISALSLGGATQSPLLLDRGRQYQQCAAAHCRAMLATSYDVPKRAKYKSIVMALYTMLQMATLVGSGSNSTGDGDGGRDQSAEFYFLEAEKCIRLKGLNRRKSRKVRLLHHCYAFERMFYESTVLGDGPDGPDGPGGGGGGNSADDSPHRRQVRAAVEASGLAAYSKDSLSFRLPAWSDLDREMAAVKSQDEGENDLHNERPGIWAGTLYPEVFGLPESWIGLISLVVRLGKEKDAAERQHRYGVPPGAPPALGVHEFLARAKTVEQYVNQRPDVGRLSAAVAFAGNGADAGSAGGAAAGGHQRMLENMIGAVHAALQIYFYRRVYDVDAALLQDKVARVRDRLRWCETADNLGGCASAAYTWSAFLAAAEAVDPDMQAHFRGWFRSCLQLTGMPQFLNALALVEQVWRERRAAVARGGCGGNATWVELFKRRGHLRV